MRNALLTVSEYAGCHVFFLKQLLFMSDREGYTCRAACYVAELFSNRTHVLVLRTRSLNEYMLCSSV